MNLQHHPELLDRLAAAYALGSLRGGARRRLETLARRQPEIRQACLRWQHRLASLNELVPQIQPPPHVWQRIEHDIRSSGSVAFPGLSGEVQAPCPAAPVPVVGGMSSGWRRWWSALFAPGARGGLQLAGAAFGIVALGLWGWHWQVLLAEQDQAQLRIVQLEQQLARPPELRYVAVLASPQGREAVLVTLDARLGQLVLERLDSRMAEGARQSLQLWALPAQGRPRSLGVLDRQARITLSAQESQLRDVPALAISLEPLGGVPSERGPTGPVLYQGRLIQRAGA